MMPFFHACGNFANAKSCHPYTQDMQKLLFIMVPKEYEKFLSEGYGTSRCEGKIYIGQDMKSVSGLTQGWSVTYSVVSKWVLGLTATHDICILSEEFCEVHFSSTEQHEDFGEAHKARDSTNMAKVSLWFGNHSPFSYRLNHVNTCWSRGIQHNRML
ncbi:hypothetical protein PR048_026726 [Dryococelus australis]|uniref:Uncharacterized protein n=1 Tax=Dryococelus australis TaxID=614101 RepID=A0ABQ9GM57_9NEOP|nr:hypothetical protein PR048_026726 [Dryococelus australis]